MDVQATSLMKQLEALRFEASGASAKPVSEGNATQDFSQLLSQALNNVNDLQGQSDQLKTRFDSGDRSVNLSDVMIAGQKASIAFEATVQVRNKVVDAYKTIMNMPV
ncbi:flagellar hook-basal body complex protein FliE [Tolumonas lignilytica]|jgi:flagellar hook-basal body complex protein FliE|uniref:flagellar hook-basal body complex protein FliE n=1 Tax=Tolumonas lignilytica TaxID=1283284 RepID=UPI00046484A1|nr:flagellar hook-basal body complex protein FliE [Tolumonas lignilytica]